MPDSATDVYAYGVSQPKRDPERERLWIRIGALIGGVVGIPTAVFLPPTLWSLHVALRGVPETPLEESMMSMSMMGFLLFGPAFGFPLGAGIGGGIAGLILRRNDAAGAWLLRCGAVTSAFAVALSLGASDVGEQLLLQLIPWRGGYLLCGLLALAAGSVLTLRERSSRLRDGRT